MRMGRSCNMVRPAGTLAAGAWLAVMVFLLSGCLFSPREPETPGTGVQIDYLAKSSPANVWANLEK